MFLSLSSFQILDIYVIFSTLLKMHFERTRLIFSSVVLTQWCVQKEMFRVRLRLVRKKLPDICILQWQHSNTCHNKSLQAARSLLKSDSQFPEVKPCGEYGSSLYWSLYVLHDLLHPLYDGVVRDDIGIVRRLLRRWACWSALHNVLGTIQQSWD